MNQKLLPAFSRNYRWADWALLLFIALACYWPFTFSVFSAKNDNIIAVLPLRYNISEAIRSGNLPFWSPYIYMGFPMHSDMQSGCWNPFVWIFSLIGRYDLNILHAEILLYIFLSGTGMYKLLQSLKLSRQVVLTGAAAYMMCGFITDVGGSNILFLAAAAFIPYLFCYYRRFLEEPGLKTSLKTVLALSLLFLCSYPSFFILSCYIMLVALVTSVILSYKRTGKFLTRNFIFYHLVLALFFLAICAPAIISYWELLPFYKRGTYVTLELSQQNNFHPASLISVLFPTASIKDPVNGTDLICRSIYFNSLLLVFLLGMTWLKKNVFYYLLLAGTCFFLFFSLGPFSLVHEWSYQLVPLLNTFRHPANARLFVIAGAIVLGCCSLHAAKGNVATGRIKWTGIFLLTICLGFFIYTVLNSSLPGKFTKMVGHSTNRQMFKSFLDGLTYVDALLINSLLQLLFLGILAWFLFFRNRLINSVPFFLINSFLFAQLSIPFTFASKHAPGEINSQIHSYPKGYPIPDLNTPVHQNSVQSREAYEKFGLASFYNKEIGAPDRQVTPTFLLSYDSLLANERVKKIVYSNPVAFLADSAINPAPGINGSTENPVLSIQERAASGAAGQGSLTVTGFSNNRFVFQTATSKETILCLQQVMLPNWKASIDGKKAAIHRGNIAFMYVSVPPGKHKVEFHYWPRHIIYALILSIIAIITSVVLLKRKNSEQDR